MGLDKRIVMTALVGSLASTSALANINNTGQIQIQGVVAGTWELTVSDFSDSYDFDLSQTGALSATVGTIHVHSNAANNAKATLWIESANNGQMKNNSSDPYTASEGQDYTFTLASNSLTGTSLTVSGGGSLPSGVSLLTRQSVLFDGATPGTPIEETLNVNIAVPVATASSRPAASGVYTDTITFTIVDGQ